jgi:TRAP-type mannitol/chloroaromatic compound transport system permease large subunit
VNNKLGKRLLPTQEARLFPSEVIAVEIGLLTAPLGLAVYVIKSTLVQKDISLADIFIGAAPFALTMLFVLILVLVFPDIAIYLVEIKDAFR